MTIPDLFPGFDARDRLGVVVHHPGGALGASVLVLATITAFYDLQRSRGDDCFVYPDYFVFHVGQQHGNHSMLDIWPDHKEVVVAGEPEAVLRAIDDRAITRLLVPAVGGGLRAVREGAGRRRHRRRQFSDRIVRLGRDRRIAAP